MPAKCDEPNAYAFGYGKPKLPIPNAYAFGTGTINCLYSPSPLPT